MSQPPSVLTAPRLWDLVADGYSREIAPHLAKYADDALRLAEVGPGQLIADVACGPGALSLSAARAGARVLAIDFSPEMIARLREQCVREGVVSIDARVGDGMKLPYDNASVDCAFSMFGLMFFPDRTQGFHELNRVLKRMGKAVVASWVPTQRVPLLADIYRTLGAILPTLPFGGNKPPLGYADDFRVEMAEAGFSNITVREVEHTLEVPSVEAFWIALARSTPPIHAVREHLGPERWEQVAHQLVESLRAKWGNGPQHVPMIANLAMGVS
jgi:ubiquinone/menaquinone biosynthesis C-methylase UbiE